MGSEDRTFIRVTAAMSKRFTDDGEPRWEKDQWLQTDGDAAKLSKAHKTTAVTWSIQTAVDLIWIRAWSGGKEVRSLLYTADDGWSASGKPLPFERRAAIRAWCSSTPLASPEGYEILNDFLGDDAEEVDIFDHDERAPSGKRATTELSPRKIEALTRQLIEAAREDDVRTVRALVEKGANPNVMPDGNAALHLELSAEMIEVLVKVGANPNLKNIVGEPPLIAALTSSNPSRQRVAALLRHGADPRLKFKGKDVLSAARDYAKRLGPRGADLRSQLRQIEPVLKGALKALGASGNR